MLQSPGIEGNDRFVSKIIVTDDSKLLIAGPFTAVDKHPVVGIARLTTTGLVDASFKPIAGPDRSIQTIVSLPDGKILIGGDFLSFDGVLRTGLARLAPKVRIPGDFRIERARR